MATDPYHTFAADLKTSLDQARQLSNRYKSLAKQKRQGGRHSFTTTTNHYNAGASSSSSSLNGDGIESQLQDTYTELQDHLESLESDIHDIQEIVEMLEKRGPELFGVNSAELGKRKRFVQSCSDEVRNLEKTVQEEARKNRKDFHSIDMQQQRPFRDDEEEDEDPNLAFEMEQQQQLLSKQDTTLDLIGNTLTSLKRQAGNLGQEIGEQVELIGTLDNEVDTAQSKLGRAVGRMDELVRRSDDRMGGWCVWILVLVLFVLLLIVILI